MGGFARGAAEPPLPNIIIDSFEFLRTFPNRASVITRAVNKNGDFYGLICEAGRSAIGPINRGSNPDCPCDPNNDRLVDDTDFSKFAVAHDELLYPRPGPTTVPKISLASARRGNRLHS